MIKRPSKQKEEIKKKLPINFTDSLPKPSDRIRSKLPLHEKDII